DGTKKSALAVDSVTIGGKPLDPEMRYKLAINDFLRSGGDGYAMFTKYDYSEYATLEEAFRNFMTEKGEADLRAISDATVLK
ncbi:MAG: 5'-nucleotidase C-terminal domain-containing protein, partial [Synergistaceae bacterium]|nr:5'-nucleotidase C-terminal domain-containing protein [Synergistaceae bacterium]